MTLLEKYEEQQEIGKEIGIEQGQDELADVINWLVSSNRNNDIVRLGNDKVYRKKLIDEFHHNS